MFALDFSPYKHNFVQLKKILASNMLGGFTHHLPIQKLEKIWSSKSSVVKVPVISPSAV